MTARVSSSVTLPDAQTCTDSVFADAPEPQVRSGPGRMAIVLTSAGDSVRTRCPGPNEDDTTHTEVLARASFALGDVGRRVLPLGLGTPRTFSARGFSGTRRGTLPLELRLVDAQIITGGSGDHLPAPRRHAALVDGRVARARGSCRPRAAGGRWQRLPRTGRHHDDSDHRRGPARGRLCSEPGDRLRRSVRSQRTRRVDASRDAELSIVEYRVAGKIKTDVSLDFDDPVGDRPGTAAE